MTIKIKAKNLAPKSNIDFMNSIRTSASSAYQDRIPEATKANVSEVIKNLNNYSANRNEFVNILFNKVVDQIVISKTWNNPFTEFKRGLLEVGETIEEIQIGLIKSKYMSPNVDTDAEDLLAREIPPVDVSYHSVSRRDRYKVTIDFADLQKAFLTTNGLSTFTQQLINTLTTSDSYDEYLLTLNLLKEYKNNNGPFIINVPDVSSPASGEFESKKLLRELRAMKTKITYPNANYNASGLETWADAGDLIFITTADVAAAVDVEALASLFNVDKAAIQYRIIDVPAEDIGISGFQGALVTSDFFVMMDTILRTETFFDPSGLKMQYFLHHHGIYSVSRFTPVIFFSSTEETTVVVGDPTPSALSALTITDRTGSTVSGALARNERYLINSAITTWVGDEVGNVDDVRYILTGNESPYTWISQGGVLTVGHDETASTIKLQAVTLKQDRSGTPVVSGTQVTKTLSGDPVDNWPLPAPTEVPEDPEDPEDPEET